MNPTNTIFDAKRLIGRNYSDTAVQSDMKHWPFRVINSGGKPKLQVEHKTEEKNFTPEEISAMILTKMKETAESYLGHEVKDAVVIASYHPSIFCSLSLRIIEICWHSHHCILYFMSKIRFCSFLHLRQYHGTYLFRSEILLFCLVFHL